LVCALREAAVEVDSAQLLVEHGRRHWPTGFPQRALEEAVDEKGEHAEGDMSPHLGVGVVPHRAELDFALDVAEVLLDAVLLAVEGGELASVSE
jgi:hypothetical protein